MKPDKIYLLLAMLIIVTSFSWITSCTHKASIADIPEICFTGEVLPIFKNSCAISGCHDGNGESDMVFDNYADISRSVVAGNPYKSSIYKVLTDTWGLNLMPPNQPLSLENRTIIRVWIEQGARFTECPDITGPTGGVINYAARACFSRDILPVLVSRCATTDCHDAATHKEGYNYSTYTSALKSVRAGNPGSSKLYQVINKTSGEEKMPPTGQLTRAEIDSIGKWISYGALNETCAEVCDTINPVTFSGTIWPIIQSSCTGCHSGASPGGNITLANYSDVNVTAANGNLLNSLNGTGVTKMPKGSGFTACRIRQFEIWINNGYLNN